MATIENFISLQDGVSPVLERMSMKCDNAATRMERLAGVTSKASNEAVYASTGFGRIRDVFAGSFAAELAVAGIQKVGEALSGIVSLSEQYAGVQARLKIMAEGQEGAAYLNDKIYESAMRARGGYLEMAQAVSSLAMSAKDAFPDPSEAVNFMEGIKKLFVVGGTSKENQKFAMLQLTQGMASGQLQGDEFRSIAENAPIIENMIAQTMGVSRGELKKLASQGEVTAEIIKKSILENMDEINKQFMQMPMTWGDLTTLASNSVIRSFEPVFKRMSDLANSEGVKKLFSGIVEVAQATAPFFYNLLGIAEWTINTVVDVFGRGIAFLRENTWILQTALYAAGAAMLFLGIRSLVTAARLGMAAVATGAKMIADWAETAAIIALTIAQDGLNAALAMCPLNWIIGAIVLLIGVFYGGIAAINYFAGTSISATGIIFGAFAWMFARIQNICIFVWNIFIALANWLMNAWDHPLEATYNLFSDIWNGIVDLVKTAVNGIIDIINKIPGIDKAFGGKFDHVEWSVLQAKRISYEGEKRFASQAYVDEGAYAMSGYQMGAKLENTMTGMFTMPNMQMDKKVPTANNPAKTQEAHNREMADSGKKTAGNTKRIADSIDMTNEEIEALRDVAMNQAVLKWQERNITIHVTNHNEVNNDMDLDGINTKLLEGLRSAFIELGEGAEI